MFNTDLGIFCSAHDNWEELLSAEPYNLKISEDGPYVMFKYNQLSSDFNNPIVREARGIIFRKGEWESPVCWAFNKFGNYGESYVPDIDWSTAFVTEKIDGSLIKVWWDGYWHVSTNGTIDAFKADLGDIKMANFGNYFISAIEKYYDRFDDFFRGLETQYTYIFELVGPYNRVVIPYEETDLYFLGARNNANGEEYYCTNAMLGAFGLGRFKIPKLYPIYSLNDCIAATQKFSWDQEGFVVVDAAGNRVKIKSPSYVLAHFARNNNVITRKHLIRVILEGEVEEFLCYASDYEDRLRDCQKLINAFYSIGNSLATSCRKARSMTRGAYSELVKSFPKMFHGLLYYNYDRDISAEEYTSGWHLNKWEEYLEAVEKLQHEYFCKY